MYFGVASLIATLLFVVSIDSIDPKLKGVRKAATIFLMILGNFYIFLLVMNFIYKFNENMLLAITISGFSIFLFDLSYSLFIFNKNDIISKGKQGLGKIGIIIKMIFMGITSLGSVVAFFIYLLKIFVGIPNTIKSGLIIINGSDLLTSFLTLFPIGLTFLYISHKVEKSEDGFKNLPWEK